jgi:hypothetical protein
MNKLDKFEFHKTYTSTNKVNKNSNLGWACDRNSLLMLSGTDTKEPF